MITDSLTPVKRTTSKGRAMVLVGPGGIFVYLFMTLVVMGIALCFAESAVRFSRDGTVGFLPVVT